MRRRSSTGVLKPKGRATVWQRLSKGKKLIVVVFLVWLIQALPKWYVALTADGLLSARIMKVFITPQSESRNDKDQAQ